MLSWVSPEYLRCAACAASLIGFVPVLHADPIGVNLDGFAYYFAAKQWVDAKNIFSPWFPLNNFNAQNISPPLTNDGYPVLAGTSISQLLNYPDGAYKVSYQGSGDFTFGGMGASIRNSQFDSLTNTTRFDLNLNRGTDGLLVMDLQNVSATDPVRNLHMYTPGYPQNQAFTNEFVRRVRPFGTLRFMDWMGTNNNPVVNWTDRTTPQTFARTGPKGAAYEDVIQLANQVNKSDVWINVPARANDDYIRHMADLFRDTLNPNLKIHVEYSNEVWNSGFNQFFDNLSVAKADPNLTHTDDFGRSAEQYALTSKHVGDIFRQEFGAVTSSRLSFVYGSQSGAAYWSSTGLGYLQTHVGDPKKYFNEIAIAPYFGNDLAAANTPDLTADQLFANLQIFIDTTLAGWIGEQKTIARQYGLALSAYEGGQSLSNLQNTPLATTAQLDRRMGAMTNHLIDVWNQQGGGLFMNFSHIGAFWGLLNSQADIGSPKWDALMSRLLLAGDANLDGVVNSKDLAILAQNYNKSGTWWEQGDFNHDGVVDALDLQMLAANYGLGTPLDGSPATALSAASFATDWALAQTEVPEPGMLSLLTIAAGSLLLSRRRRPSLPVGAQ